MTNIPDPFYDPDWQERYRPMISTAKEALRALRPGQRIFIGTGCAEPQELVQALIEAGFEK